jgi:hypothetical protein
MTEAAVSFAGNLTNQPELRHTESGIARAVFRVAVSGPPRTAAPVHGRGHRRRAGADPAVGNGDHDQDDEEPGPLAVVPRDMLTR